VAFRQTDEWSSVPWRRVWNTSSFTVPPFGAMKLVGRDVDRYLMKVGRPDAAGIDPRTVWFNGPYSIPPNFEGFGTPDPYPLAAYDDSSGTPSVGQVWRTQNGSWLLSPSGSGKPGFIVVAEPDTAYKCVSVTRDAISPGVPPCGSPSDTVSFFGTNCTTNQQVRYDLTGYVDADGKWWGCVNPVPTGPANCCTTRATFAPTSTARVTMNAAGPTAVDNLDGSYTVGDGDTVYTDLTPVITGGTVGDATHAAQLTFNNWGQLVAAASVPISFPAAGDVYGPSSTTDLAVALFDGTTGKLIRDGTPRVVSYNPATGGVRVKQAAGSWSFSFGVTGSGGTDRGGFGFTGGTNAVSSYWIGPDQTHRGLTVTAGGEEVSNWDATGDPTLIRRRLLRSAGQSVDMDQICDEVSSPFERVNKDGYRVIKKTSAPADGDLNNSEMAWWCDDANGWPALKMKKSDGTVVNFGTCTQFVYDNTVTWNSGTCALTFAKTTKYLRGPILVNDTAC
jgi:hypothetical protein